MDIRILFFKKALDDIPKILTLLDRNPHSPTYGCFDRNFWHYKIIDFPSGMSQELVWPLALAYDTESPDNPYFRKSAIRDWVLAGLKFAAGISHKDGSCDDYYPFEKASGAAAFSLLAFLESYKLLGFDDPVLMAFFTRRADWLAAHMESGRLSNHQALIALCLQLTGDLMNTDRWDQQKNQRLETVFSWQNEEGWFQEYEGCDPGYHTLTLMCLAWLFNLNPGNRRLKTAVERAVDIALEFIHPDGTYGGEYGSRNTNNYFSYGFELAGRWKPEALFVNDLYARSIQDKRTPCFADDHILGHHIWNDFLTYRNYLGLRPDQPPSKKRRTWLKQAGILIDRQGDTELFVALNKGGVFKFFHGGRLVCADTNFSVRVRVKGKENTAVAHLIDDYDITVEDNCIRINGYLGWAKQKQMNTVNLLLLRLVMMTAGRLFPDLIRKILQLLLITGKKRTEISFSRCFVRQPTGWQIKDQLRTEDWSRIKSVGMGCDQTSIHVVMSRTFHLGQLFPFIDLSYKLEGLGPGDELVHERILP